MPPLQPRQPQVPTMPTFNRRGIGGNGGPALFDFELLNEAGSGTITSVPNLRIFLTANSLWNTLVAAGTALGVTLTIARGGDGKTLVISGWPSGTIPSGTQFHFEQRIPGEINRQNVSVVTPAGLFAKKVGDPALANTSMPGIGVACTRYDFPIGVT